MWNAYNLLTKNDASIKHGTCPLWFVQFSWTQYFNTLGFKVKPDDEVVVFHPGYLANLTTLLLDTRKSPPDLR